MCISNDTTQEGDILLKDILDVAAAQHKSRFSVHYILTENVTLHSSVCLSNVSKVRASEGERCHAAVQRLIEELILQEGVR